MARRSDSQPCEPEYTRSELDALLNVPCAPSDTHGTDELLEWIEDYDGDARFIPDWSGESYRNAA